jgi:GT2 family glycosyltransferase
MQVVAPEKCELSVILVNWNTARLTCDCVASVFAAADSVDLEIILVDNASTDGSVDLMRRRHPSVRIIENGDNRGFAAANNQGMAAAGGRYLLLLNSDTIVLRDALRKTLDFADAHPDAGIVGCRLLNPDGSLQRSCFQYPSISNLLLSAFYLNKLFPRSRFFGKPRDVESVMGAFMLVRRNAYSAFGGMDEDYFMYGEETDWCRRCTRAGWRVMFTPDGCVTHFGGQSSRQVRMRSIVQLRLGILQYCFKHLGRLSYTAAGCLVSLFFLVRIPLWLFLSVLNPGNENYRNRSRAYLAGWLRVVLATVAPRREYFKAQ